MQWLIVIVVLGILVWCHLKPKKKVKEWIYRETEE